MRFRFIFFILILLSACAVKKTAKAPPLVQVPPQWVEQRPTDPTFYIGIGTAAIQSSNDHLRLAKENALSDLASEIEVRVQSNSLLYTLETNNLFKQEYSESIRISSNMRLEDFEMVDSWQDDHYYWVYYRMSKEAYARQIKQKKSAAQNLALDFLTKGDVALKNNSFATAADYYLRGLQALEYFWNESHQTVYEGENILLNNTLYFKTKQLINSTQIQVDNALDLNFNNRYKTVARIVMSSDFETAYIPKNIPLVYEYFGEYGIIRGKTTTDANGCAEIEIDRAAKNRSDNALRIFIDTDKLFKSFVGDRFMQQLTSTMTGAETTKKITYNPPVVYLESTELNLDHHTYAATIESAIISSFAQKGIRLTTNADAADIKVILRANTKKSGSENGFFTSTLRVLVEVWDLPKGDLRYKISKDNIKGVDLNFEKAGLRSYQNFIKNIESELMRQLVSHLL